MRTYLHTYLPYLLPALLLVLVQYMIAGFGITTQLLLLAVAMGTTGIPHGALDYLIFTQQEKSAGRKHSLLRFLCYYLGLMAFYALLWWVSPSLSLVFFLMLSAWHFADNDLAALPLSYRSDHFLRLAFGTWLLLALIFSHTSELLPYLQQIVGNEAFLLRFAQWYQPFGTPVFWVGVLGWPVLLLFRLRGQTVPVKQYFPLLTLMLMLVLCRQLPMILGFAVYFAIWHSLHSFRSIWLYLRRHNRFFRSARQLVVPALPFVAGAFIGLGAFFFWSNATQNSLTPLWIFLSLITLPHGLLMHEVYEGAEHKPSAHDVETA